MTRITQKSFTAGELSPSLYARNDLAKYAVGLKTLKNGFVRAEGCVSNRAGLELVGEVKNSNKKVRIIPFSFNTEQTYIIELGDKYARFIKDGGYILHGDAYGRSFYGTYGDETTGTNDNGETYYKYTLGGAIIDHQLQGVIYLKNSIAVNETVYLDKNFETVYISEKNSLAEGKISKLTGINTIYIDYNADEYPKRAQIVEIETPYAEDDLFNIKYAQSADVLTLCHNNYTPKELSRIAHDRWNLDDIISAPQIIPPDNVAAVYTGDASSNTTEYKYVVTAVKNDGTDEESERSEVATVTGHLEAFWTTSEYITVSWDSVDGAEEYNIYRSVNGVYGYIGTSTETTFKDNKIEPDLTSTAPIARDPFENGNYPACVNYYKQRKIFGCLKNSPQALVTSQTGTENNFNISRPLNDSDSLSIKIAEREVNEIRHIIGLNDLIVLTSGAEWKLTGSDGSISASSPPSCVPQSYYGCSHIQPCVSGNMVLFVQAGGSVVRDLGYEYVSDSYNGDELSIFANHLFENKQVTDMAYSKEPYRILWCVMSDGTVNALTYNKKQEVAGWHQHVTKGNFESVAVIREGFEDVAYFVVKRTINSQTKRFVERMHSRLIERVEDGFFVDCGLKAKFNSYVTTISGLSHLEGEKVAVCADGGAYYKTVENAQITLDSPAKNVSVGLPYTFELETLNIEGENTHGLVKIINNVNVKVEKSREDFSYVNDDGTTDENPRNIASINDSGLLYDGDVRIYPTCNYLEERNFKITQPLPLPITVTSMTFDVSIQDTN